MPVVPVRETAGEVMEGNAARCPATCVTDTEEASSTLRLAEPSLKAREETRSG